MTMSKSESGLAQTVQETTYIGGKPYAGVLLNARPYVEAFPRCLVGFIDGKDFAGRGFDNKTVHTSTVEKLIVDGYDIYAITKNSAYLIQTMNLMLFVKVPEWEGVIENLIKESKID